MQSGKRKALADQGEDRRFMDMIGTYGTVYAVYPMDASVSGKVAADELVRDAAGMLVDNKAVRSIMPKKRKYCVFSDGFLEPASNWMMMWVNGDDNSVVGHEVLPGMEDKVQEGAVWVSSTFVMYPKKLSKGAVKVVFMSYPLNLLQDKGVRDAEAYNPSRETHEYLCSRFGYDGPRNSVSTIVAFDRC